MPQHAKMWNLWKKAKKEEMDPMFWKEKQLVREINTMLFIADYKVSETTYMYKCYERDKLLREAERYYDMAKSAAKELAVIHEKRL